MSYFRDWWDLDKHLSYSHNFWFENLQMDVIIEDQENRVTLMFVNKDTMYYVIALLEEVEKANNERLH